MAVLATGILVAAALVFITHTISGPGETCALDSEVGSAYIWTLGEIVNVPDGGSAGLGVSGENDTFSSGSLNLGENPSDGGGSWSSEVRPNSFGLEGNIGLGEWDMFSVRNVSTMTAGRTPCTQPFVAQLVDGSTICGAVGNLTTLLPLENNSSDVIEPHTIPPESCGGMNATPGAGMWFDTSFHTYAEGSSTGTSGTMSLCGNHVSGTFNVTLSSTASIPVVVSISVNGSTIQSVGSAFWIGGSPQAAPTAQYSLPFGWSWNISTIGGPGHLPTLEDDTTTQLLAFVRTPCPV